MPGFVRSVGIRTWAQFFLKYALSHPAVTVVLQTTTKPEHVEENMAAMYGPLPDEAMRREMVRYMQSIPGFEQLESTPWYPGKTFDGYVRL